MLEIEQKFRNVDFDDLQRRLQAFAATSGTTIHEADHYFNGPDRDFKQTGEAFRLRRVGAANCLTYKGPKLNSAVKARRELEIALRDGDQAATEMIQMLEALGYRFVAVVRKVRRTFALERSGYLMQVCCDDVAGVGQFTEVEIVAAEENLEAARAEVQRLAEELGLREVEPRSYLHLLLVAEGRE